jgi:hypothetical protein
MNLVIGQHQASLFKVAAHLEEDSLIAGRVNIGSQHLGGVAGGDFTRFPDEAGSPQTKQLVPTRLGFETQFLVVHESGFFCPFPFIESGHRGLLELQRPASPKYDPAVHKSIAPHSAGKRLAWETPLFATLRRTAGLGETRPLCERQSERPELAHSRPS